MLQKNFQTLGIDFLFGEQFTEAMDLFYAAEKIPDTWNWFFLQKIFGTYFCYKNKYAGAQVFYTEISSQEPLYEYFPTENNLLHFSIWFFFRKIVKKIWNWKIKFQKNPNCLVFTQHCFGHKHPSHLSNVNNGDKETSCKWHCLQNYIVFGIPTRGWTHLLSATCLQCRAG